MDAFRFRSQWGTARSARHTVGCAPRVEVKLGPALTRASIPAPASNNPIVAWVNAKGGRVGDYLDQLITVDMTLSESLAGTYCLAESRRRLALTLFIDYAHEQGLSPGETQQRLAQLSAEDLRTLAANTDQIRAAGRVPNYIWWLLAALIAVTIITTIA